jgi:hypothetical protein
LDFERSTTAETCDTERVRPCGPVVDSSEARFVGESFYYNAAWDDVFSNKGDDDDELHEKLYAITSTGYDSGHELTHAPQPNPNPNPDKWPWTDPDFDWDYWTNLEDSAPPKRPKLFGQAPENQVEHANVQQPNPGPPTDPDIDWKYWMNLDDPPPPRPSPEKFGQAHVEHVR